MRLEIDRAKWRTGDNCDDPDTDDHRPTGSGQTALLNREGYMCCLGFLALEAGYSEEDILGRPEPESVTVDDTSLFPDFIGTIENDDTHPYLCQSPATAALMGANDDYALTREEREESIASIFAENGVTVVFTGEYED